MQLRVAGEYCRMQTFFPSRQDVEDDDAIDYVILGEQFSRVHSVWR